MTLGNERSDGARILVVDDDAGLLRLIEKSLRREGFEVATAQSSPEVIARLAEGPCALMLVDLGLADTTGQELLEDLGRRNIFIPFMVITGQGDERTAVELMKKGALDYLVKDAEFLESMPTRVRRAVETVRQKERLTFAEAALKQEHAFISAILDTAGALVIVLDCEGKIVRFNRAAEEATGFSSADVAGKKYLDFFVPEEEQREVSEIFERLLRGAGNISHQNHIRNKSGGTLLVTWSNTHIGGDAGEPSFLIKTGIDITERRRLEQQILEISNREQRRIGQDLHDGLGQHLTGIELLSQCLEQTLAKKKRPEAELAAKISRHVRDAIGQAKSLARGLSPVELEQHGLMFALRELCRGTTELCRVTCRFECPTPIPVEDITVATHLFRIAQEAVNNAVKHGRANEITVTLAPAEKERCSLSVRDNGLGFKAERKKQGMGLAIMKYRASVIDAGLEIHSVPGKGTEVHCIFSKGPHERV